MRKSQSAPQTSVSGKQKPSSVIQMTTGGVSFRVPESVRETAADASKAGLFHRCPYCDEEIEDEEELTLHIDNYHIGPGLLQGDWRKW